MRQFMIPTQAQPKQAKRISDAVYDYANHGRGDVKKLQGDEGSWRLRVGDWRVIFELHPNLVRVVRVEDRSEVYR